jgi:hypothetical protein
MSQVSQVTVDNQSFPNFRSALNNTINALNTNHLGSSRPASAGAGTIWLDNSTTNTIVIKVFDGSDDLTIFSLNTATNVVTVPSGVSVEASITETDPTATALAIALG